MDENAKKLLEKRYFLRDEKGNLIEHSWEDISKRVGMNVASAENNIIREYWSSIFTEKINNMDFIPSSPCLFNAGTRSQQLSSCFVVNIEDNIEGIFHTVAECAKIFQMSGGAGLSMKKIRPKGASCASSGSNASGVVSFMHIFDEVVNRVKQGNKRNGALKIDLPVDHPEIVDFIHCKDNTTELNNMNISVSLTAAFIEAVEKDLDWDLVFNGKLYSTVKAKTLWNEIITSAWKTGEPGISYQDNMNAGNMNPHISQDICGNPCHEFVNIPYSSCNLASVNLPRCIIDGKLDYEKLRENIGVTFRFLDDMLTVNKLPLDIITQTTLGIRPIGLGTMGLADLLFELKIPYGSPESIAYINSLYAFIRSVCIDTNIDLAIEKGEYPLWKGSRWEKDLGIKVRCSSMLSIAPNGSIAMISNVTGGIEPTFALVYTRVDNEKETYYIVNPVFEKYLKNNNLNTKAVLQTIVANKGSIQGLDSLFPKEIQAIYVTASDISPEEHVNVLAAIQMYVDLSISKTVNLPFNATKEDIGNVYLRAGKLGIKGVTVYRDGSRDSQVLYTTTPTEKSTTIEKKRTELARGEIIDAPESAPAIRIKVRTGCGKLYLIISYDVNGDIIETFIETGSDGGCEIFTVATSRLISLALRGGISLEKVVDQLNSSGRCGSYMFQKGRGKDVSPGKACPSAIGLMLIDIQKKIKSLKKLGIDPTTINDIIAGVDMKQIDTCSIDNKEQSAEDLREDLMDTKMLCPECRTKMLSESGCVTCKQCGYSKCS